MQVRPTALFAAAFAALALAACEDENSARSSDRSPTAEQSTGDRRSSEEPLAKLGDERLAEFFRSYASLAHAAYHDAAERSDRLSTVVELLVDRPTPDRLDAARQAWRAAVPPVESSLVYNAVGAPPALERRARRVAPAPVPPAPFDVPDAGREISEPDGGISKSTLARFARKRADSPVAGLHAVELFLWGPGPASGDRSRTVADLENAGAAPLSRSPTVLLAASELLADDLEALANAWGRTGDLRTAFLERKDSTALGEVLDGLRETAKRVAETLRAARASGDTGRVDSPYARATRAALVARMQGFAAVFRGSYERTDNSTLERSGLSDLVEPLDAQRDGDLETHIDRSLDALDALPDSLAPLGEPSEDHRRAAAALEAVRELLGLVETLRDLSGADAPDR